MIPRLDYWTARVRNNAPVPKYDTTLEKWVFEPLGDTDKTNGDIKRPLIVPKQRIRFSPLKETLGLRLQSENQATKSYTASEGPNCPRLSEHESDSECQTSGELDPYAYFVDEFEKARKSYTAAKGPSCPRLSENESDSECQTSGELDPYGYFVDKFEKAIKKYTAAEGPNCPRLSEYESDSECQTSGELDPYRYFADKFEKAIKKYTAAEGPNCPRLSEHESDSECQTSGELDPYGYFADKFEKALKNYRAESDGRSEQDDSKTRHELEGDLTDDGERTVPSPVEGEDPMWWCPSPTLDFLFTHSSPDEFGRKYRTWSELETSEGQNSPVSPC